jgi:uncharacterized protein YjdB
MFLKKEYGMIKKWRSRRAGIALICALVFFGACGNITINTGSNGDSTLDSGPGDSGGGITDNGGGDDGGGGGGQPVPVTGVIIAPVGSDVIEGQTLQLAAAVSPDNATDKTLTWTSSDPATASVESDTGLVTGVAAGNAVITASSVDGPGDKVTVTVVSISVTLNTAETYIIVEGTEQLSAAIDPSHAAQTVTWSSGDENVATVGDTGLVSAVGTGTAFITATSTADTSKTATCEVHVVDTVVPLSGLTLSPNPLVMVKGAIVPITVSYTPSNTTERAITWESSDEAVAIPYNGMVYAAGAGTASITATSAVNTGISDTITVNVTVPVSWVNLDSTSLDLILGGTTGTLTAEVGPADAGNKSVTWENSDNTVVSLSGSGNSCTLTALKTGTAVITVKSVAAPGKTKSCTVRVHEQGINIVFSGIEDETIDLGVVEGGSQIVITATGGFNRYLWYLNGEYMEKTTGPTLSYDIPGGYIPPGTYYITVIVNDGGYHFSKTLAYTVVGY